MAPVITKRSGIAITLCLLLPGLMAVGCTPLAGKKKSLMGDQGGVVAEQGPVRHREGGKILSLESRSSPDQVEIIVQSDAKLQYSAYQLTKPERLLVELIGTGPGNYQSPIVVDKGLVRKVTPVYFPESNTTRIEVALDNPTEYNINQEDDKTLIIEIKTPPREAAREVTEPAKPGDTTREGALKNASAETDRSLPRDATPATNAPVPPEQKEEYIYGESNTPNFTGQKISMDFQKADVKNILRLLAEVSGLNIITTPEVRGTVTMRLTNVPWDQALDLILKNNNLGMEKKGNIIRIATKSQIDAEKSSRLEAKKKFIEEKADKMKAKPLITETVRISYADITKLAQNIGKLKSKRGSITVDERTFTLILVDVEENLQKMKQLIATLDIPPKQVAIEARIVEVSRNYSRQLGIRWGGSTNTQTQGGKDVTVNGTQPGDFIVDMPAAVGPGAGGAIGVLLGRITDSSYLNVQLSALESAGMGKIISNPRITTKDNVEATIESGKDIPFETVSQDGTSTDWRKATIKLVTTPHITPDGFVSMKIDAAKDEPDPSLTSASGVPSISTRNIKTEILVKDGETIVLGGLFKKSKNTNHGAVPWLSKIPVLGLLFKNKIDTNNEEELLIFITPRILDRRVAKTAT